VQKKNEIEKPKIEAAGDSEERGRNRATMMSRRGYRELGSSETIQRMLNGSTGALGSGPAWKTVQKKPRLNKGLGQEEGFINVGNPSKGREGEKAARGARRSGISRSNQSPQGKPRREASLDEVSKRKKKRGEGRFNVGTEASWGGGVGRGRFWLRG